MILEKKVVGLNEAAMQRFVLRARKAAGLSGQVNVLITGSAALRSLNQRFRSQNKATDVLSFPAASAISQGPTRSNLVGEVVISADIARKNSFLLGHSATDEVKILALHGILHLAGYDHERDHGEMARKEAKLRRALKLPLALIERAKPERTKLSRSQTPKVHRNGVSSVRRTA